MTAKHRQSEPGEKSITFRSRARDATSRVFNFPATYFIGLPALLLSGYLLLPEVYSDIRDHFDPSRIDRRTIGTNVGKVFERRHVHIECGYPNLKPEEGGVRVGAKVEPGGYIYSVKQADKTDVTIHLSTPACDALIAYDRQPSDPEKLKATTGFLVKVLVGTDHTAGLRSQALQRLWPEKREQNKPRCLELQPSMAAIKGVQVICT